MARPHLPRIRTLPPARSGQRIGLFGGSFDPPHSGHLHVARTALKRLDLDWVYWLPARGNPLKSAPADFQGRLQGVRELIGHSPDMVVSDFEMQAGLRYSVDVLARLTRRCPDARLVWLMGADSLGNFHRWKHWQTIAETLPLCVVSRPSASGHALHSPFARRYAGARLAEHDAVRLPDISAPAWVYLKAPFDPVSSTQLRTRNQKS